MVELWKKISGFPMYEVSNYGKVRSLHTGKLKSVIQGKIFLCKNGKECAKPLTHLVAKAFIPNTLKCRFCS